MEKNAFSSLTFYILFSPMQGQICRIYTPLFPLPYNSVHYSQEFKEKLKTIYFLRKLIINNDVSKGTQLPYIEEAKKLGLGVVVFNTNQNSFIDEGNVKRVS